MASWDELQQVASSLGGVALSDAVLKVSFDLDGGRSQQVMLRHELLAPDLQFLFIESPIAMLSVVDAPALIARAGQLVVGSISSTPAGDGDFILALGLKLPLAALDSGALGLVALLMNLIARAADQLEQEHMPAGMPDVF